MPPSSRRDPTNITYLISLSADLRNEALEHKIEIPETIQGENKFNTLVEEDEKIKNFFIKYFRDLILSE